MKKRLLRVLAIFFGLIVLIMALGPLVFRSNIGALIKRNVNANITGTLDFKNAQLSLFRNFPNASFTLEDVLLTTKAPFEGDTLLTAGKAGLTMSVWELFKSEEEPITVKSLFIDNAALFLKVDDRENPNYDIAVQDKDSTAAGTGFTFSLEEYAITDSEIYYSNLKTGISFELLEIQHSGNGNLALDNTELNTETEALMSFTMDEVAYMTRNKVTLSALLGIDFNTGKYSFLKNMAYINRLPLVFDGYVQLFEDYDAVAINFRTPDSDFKNFLAVIPEKYARNIAEVETAGTFTVTGKFNGRVDDTYIPEFEIEIVSENASFKFPELPKAVNDIQIRAQVVNTTGIAEDTYVAVDKVSFVIDGREFNLSSRISQLLGNTTVDAKIKGALDLANLEKVYPLEDFKGLKGLLKADVSTQFDMAAVENKQYNRVKASGLMDLTNFEYYSPELPEVINIEQMQLRFSPGAARLDNLKGTMGKSDFKATGQVNNVLGYLFLDEKVQGNFELTSNTLFLDDFVAEKRTSKSAANNPEAEGVEGLQIPAFLDCSISTNIKTVRYDNLELSGVSGSVRIKDQTAGLYGMNAALLGGNLRFEGEVATAGVTPVFNMKLNLADLGISRTFENIKLLRVLAPVAQALEGKLTSEIALEGSLLKDLNLDFNTISGGALAELSAAELNPGSAKVLNALSSKLAFIKPENLNLKGLKTALTFEDGIVKVAPFTFNYQDIVIRVEGGHSFNAALNYQLTLDVPAKYLGNEVNSLIEKIGEPELNALTIPVTATVSGPYTRPGVTTDLTSGVKTLTARLVAIQKQKLIDKGTDKTKDLLEGVLNKRPKDSVGQQDTTGTTVQQTVRDIFNRNKKRDSTVMTKDSVPATGDRVKETARGVLGGLLGKKKKDSATIKADSIKQR